MKKFVSILVFILLFSIHVLPQQQTIDSLIDLVGDSLSPGSADLYNKISLAYDYTDSKKSLEYAMKARKAAQREKNRGQLALAYRNIGNYYNTKFQLEKARENYTIALQIYQAEKDRIGEARIINLLGILHGKNNQYDSAFVYFTKAYEIAEKLKDSTTLTMIYTNFGLVYHHWGDYKQAMKYYELSQEINLALNIKEGLEKNYYNLGKIAHKWDKIDLALEYFKKAYDIVKSSGNQQSIANIFIDIGNVYSKLDQQDSALFYYQKSYDVAKNHNLMQIMGIALGNIGNLYKRSDDYKTAFQYYTDSYEILKKTKDKKRISQRLNAMSDLFRRMEQYDSAKIYLDRAYRMTKELKYKDLEQECLLDYYLLYDDQKQYKNALAFFVRYSNLKDTLFNESSRRELAEFEAKYETEKQTSKIKFLEKEKEINSLDLNRQKMQKNFFIVLAVLLILLGMLLFNRYQLRQRNYRSQVELQTQAMEQRLLRAQMNPHFIFNSLNAIQSFITENNAETASRFLRKFADLIRYNLESTRNAFVPLEQEINALENNLELESIRFNHCFDFKITIDEAIDPVNLTIPPLLIQPFIENSIIHGLATKNSDGLLEVEFVKKDKTIDALITDNGIGREKSAQIKDGKKKGKKSLGIQLIKERLDLLNRQGNTNSSFKIVDLYDDKHQPSGTKVILNIPYELNY
ncbi:MAG: DUF2225 domain-containing protein [Bacteroidales bacterium]|nr:DUF2225 domain-containing protein [Bacteroidales bacterium]MCF8456587.1 DUF2225 domain-containing protein [Bacteroidales bacterium]